MECEVITPYFSKSIKVKEISVENGEGKLIIYPLHTDFISSIKKNSVISIKTLDKEEKYKCNQGVIKIQSNKALIIIDTNDNM